jgi:serine O-acetyltransferase
MGSGLRENNMFCATPPPENSIWAAITAEADRVADSDRVLGVALRRPVFDRRDFCDALAFQIGTKLAAEGDDQERIGRIARDSFREDSTLATAAALDLQAVLDRDPATPGALIVLLHHKGYIALQAWRVSHRLWSQQRYDLAQFLHGCACDMLDVSIHPSAVIGSSVVIDHGSGIIIGATVAVGDGVTILQNVTIGRAERSISRSPRIGSGVMLSSGATILGDITIGDFAKIGAGSLVTESVPAHCTAVGSPARLVNCAPAEAAL